MQLTQTIHTINAQILFFFFPPGITNCVIFALKMAKEGHGNDWRLVFEAVMGFNFGDNDIEDLNWPI